MHFLAHDNPHIMCERAYYVRHNVNIWDGIVGVTIMSCSLLLTALLLSNGVTLTLFYYKCMELHLSLRGRGCGFSTTEPEHTVRKTSASG